MSDPKTAAANHTAAADGELRGLVDGHRPNDQREEESKLRFLAELSRLEHPLDEHADLVHVTASAIVVGERGTVLHRHRRLGKWMQPGGHIDAGEQPADAALRESKEETGLSLRHPPAGPLLINIDVHQGANTHTHLDLRYLLIGDDEDPKPPPEESQDVAWFDWEGAEAIAADGTIGALRAARRSHQGGEA